MLGFGPIYRQLRIAKGIKVKEATFGICTPQSLNRFEKGDSNISIDVFQKLLSRLFISWGEFMSYVDDRFIDEYLYVSKAIDQAFLSQNTPQLHHLANHYLELAEQNEELSHFYKLLSISIRSKIFELNPKFELRTEDITFVQKHLDKIETWGNFELFLIANLVQILPLKYLKHTYICNENIRKKVKLTLEYSQNNELILNNSLSFINRLIIQTMLEKESYKDIAELIEIISADSLYFFNHKANKQQFPIQFLRFSFVKGLILLSKDNEKGNLVCQKALNTLMGLEHYSVITNQMYDQLQYFNMF